MSRVAGGGSWGKASPLPFVLGRALLPPQPFTAENTGKQAPRTNQEPALPIPIAES